MSFLDIISITGIRADAAPAPELVWEKSVVGARAGRNTVAFSLFVADVEAAARFEAESRALAARALEPNVFYEPAAALAAARHLTEARGARFVFLWETAENAGPPPRLLGVFPVLLARSGFGAPLMRGWQHPQAMLGTPLVDNTHAEAVIEGFLSWAVRHKSQPAGMLFPKIIVGGKFHALLDAFLARQGQKASLFEPQTRAVITRETALPTRVAALSVDGVGVLTARSAREGAQLRTAVEDFLALEPLGARGPAGTALVQDAGRAAFARAQVWGLAATRQVVVQSLWLEERLIASAIMLASGRTGYIWALCQDDAFATHDPARRLVSLLGEQVRPGKELHMIDSCGAADFVAGGTPWPDTLTSADMLVPLSVQTRLRFGLARARETAGRGMRARLGALASPKRNKAPA